MSNAVVRALDSMASRVSRQRGATAALVTVWMAALLIALAWLSHYKLTPGTVATPAEHWPAASRLASSPGVPTLVIFVHPLCPCTRASLSELRYILPRFERKVVCEVVFLRSEGTPDGWAHSDTWASATALPDVRVVEDLEGREASLFGATTSGHVVLYAADGRLLFSGGVTPGRGHIGDNPQLDRLVTLLESATSNGSAQPTTVSAIGAVYGCPLEERKK